MERKLLFHISFEFHRDTIAMEEKKKCPSTEINCLVLQCGEQTRANQEMKHWEK